jgi:hypothetical protein
MTFRHGIGLDSRLMELSAQVKAPGPNSGLRELRRVPLTEVAAAVKAGDAELAEALRRITPRDGVGFSVAPSDSAPVRDPRRTADRLSVA